MREADALVLRAGLGILGDCNAAGDSPRQVLIASEPVYRRLGLAPGALRENFQVDAEVERFSSGQVLRIGSDVRVRLTIPCEPCAKLNRVRPGLARDAAGHRGFLGRVISDGEVRRGDEVVPTDVVLDPIPFRPRDRVYDLVARIPPGRVLGFKALVRTLGLVKTYVRVVPRFLATAPQDLPIHRVVTSEGALIPQHVAHQRLRLRDEGVCFAQNGRVRGEWLWDSAAYFSGEPIRLVPTV